MPTYTYQARDARGASVTNIIEAESEHAAIQSLRGDGLTVTDIRLGKSVIDVEEVQRRQAAKSVKREEVIAFSSQLSVMLETGVPVSEALKAYMQQARGGNLKKVIEVVADRINSGVSFSVAISDFPRVFPNMMVSLVKASEATGALGSMLGRVATYLSKDRRIIKQIRGALTYPMAMIGMAFAVTLFLVTWVLPRFAKIYESREATLPTPTRVLITASETILGNIPLIILAVVSCVVGFVFFSRSNRGREVIDWCKLNAPIIGPVYRNFYITRATRTLATLLAAGVSLPRAVRITAGMTGNKQWERLWKDMEESMSAGRTIGEIVVNSDLMPQSFAQMISAGERTGRLPEVLDKVASVSEEDLDEGIKSSTQFIEPLVITLMGVMIGGIAMALLLPVFTMGSTMSQ